MLHVRRPQRHEHPEAEDQPGSGRFTTGASFDASTTVDDTDAVAFDNIDRIPTNEISNERDKKEKTVFCRVKSFNRGISRRMKVLESLRY